MQVKVGSTKSSPRPVYGPSPQGTKIGNYLFTITIESIEEMGEDLSRNIPPQVETPIKDAPHARRFATRPIDRFMSNEFTMASTLMKASTTDGVLRYNDVSGRGEDSFEIELALPDQPPPHGPELKDNTIISPHRI